MSSSSTMTVRAGSGEPPAKRQKIFAYGPEIVWLGALDRNGGSEIVAVVHKVKLREVYSGSSNSVKARQSSDFAGNVEIERVDLKFHADSVRLFAHWVQERDIKSALDSCQHERRFGIPFLCEMLEFYSKESLSNEFHDCSIDNFIDLMRDAVNNGCSEEEAINEVYNGVESIESGGESRLTNTAIAELLATLHLHHIRSDLSDNLRENTEDNLRLNLFHDIRVYAVDHLLDAAAAGTFENLPKDPLQDSFDQHCLYHKHKKAETCYRDK
ncbi:hypothetical protein D6D06_07832 [Aureobasidium pullulans]|nr:hypothetical protein D6D06_07832 [Aureobasidium pullulans]